MIAEYFLWGGLTVFVTLPPVPVFSGLTFAGLLMLIGLFLLILGK
jgi:hypothetical protein